MTISPSTSQATALANRLPITLFLLRLGVSLVFFVWVLDKFVNSEHTVAVFEKFYGLGEIGTPIVYGLGVVQLLIVLAFVTGFLKAWSYGLVLLMHGASTLVAFRQYFAPFEGSNLLFFTAWPMLAACVALFLLRDFDTLATIDQPQQDPPL